MPALAVVTSEVLESVLPESAYTLEQSPTAEPSPPATPTPALDTSWAPRTGQGGPYADALVLFDRAHQWFARSMQEPYILAGFPECAGDVDHDDYFITLLVQLSDHGGTTYTTAASDQVLVTTFEAWLELFCTNVLDVFAQRCSALLERGADGDAEAQAVGTIYLEVLRTLLPEALAVVGYAPVAAFPCCGMKPNTETMRVVGNAFRPSHAGEVVGVRQYGLMKGRKLVRQALVTVG